MTAYFDSTGVCELAALYSLGALSEPDTWHFREHLLLGCGQCREELDGFESVTAALAFAAPPASPSPILRDRIFDEIAEREPALTAADVAGDPSLWEPYVVPGIQIRRLHVDQASRRAVLIVRAEPGARYPSHRHAAVEEMFMLQGELRFGDRTYRPGDYIRSECSTVHEASETPGGCMFLLRTSLDNEVQS